VIKHDGSVTGVLVFCPAGNQIISAHTAGNLYSIAQLLTASGIRSQFMWMSMSDIIDSRNVSITKFYDEFPQCSHFLSLDNDMHFTPQLIIDMFKAGKDVTGIAYAKREYPLSVILRPLNDDNKVIDGFLEVSGVGGGVLLVKRDVVSKIMKKFPEVNDCNDVGTMGKTGITRVIRAFDRLEAGGVRLSEDFAFCERARQAGCEVWANVSHAIGHVGPFEYTMRYGDIIAAHQQKEAA